MDQSTTLTGLAPEAEEYIRETYNRKLSAATISSKLGLSKRQLATAVKKLGISRHNEKFVNRAFIFNTSAPISKIKERAANAVSTEHLKPDDWETYFNNEGCQWLLDWPKTPQQCGCEKFTYSNGKQISYCDKHAEAAYGPVNWHNMKLNNGLVPKGMRVKV